ALDVAEVELDDPQRREHGEGDHARSGPARQLRSDSPENRRGGNPAHDGEDSCCNGIDRDSHPAKEARVGAPDRRCERLAEWIRVSALDPVEPDGPVTQEPRARDEPPEEHRPRDEKEPGGPTWECGFFL